MLFKIENPAAAPVSIPKAMVIKMVDYYRNNRRRPDGTSLKFAHVPLTELVQLFVDNGIIDALTPDQQNKIVTYGIKIYMANHANDPTTIPTGRNEYLLSDTVVICNTKLNDADPQGTGKIWTDMLEDTVIIGSSAGTGLDKSTICPPDCPGGCNDISTVKDPV